MKKFMCKYGMLILVMVLAAGIFCVFWGMKSRDTMKNGILVKNICEEAQKLRKEYL